MHRSTVFFLAILNIVGILANPVWQNLQDAQDSSIDTESFLLEQPIRNDELISLNDQNNLNVAGCTSESSTTQLSENNDDGDGNTLDSQSLSVFRRQSRGYCPSGISAPPKPGTTRSDKDKLEELERLVEMSPEHTVPTESDNPCPKKPRIEHVTCEGPEVRIEPGSRPIAFIVNCIAGKSRSHQGFDQMLIQLLPLGSATRISKRPGTPYEEAVRVGEYCCGILTEASLVS